MANKEQEEKLKSSIFGIIAKLDNGSHSANQLQGVDEELLKLFSQALTEQRNQLKKEYEETTGK